MSTKVSYKDKDGFRIKYPERSCKFCRKYPCLEKMDRLKSDFAKLGCLDYVSVNEFDLSR